jgi:hypothetical protein
VLDLDYIEDADCDTDMNVVMTGSGGIVEVQGTAEGDAVFPRHPRGAARPGDRRHRADHRGPARGAGRLSERRFYR